MPFDVIDGEPPWEEVPAMVKDFADADLRRHGEVTPCLAAYAGDRLAFFGFCRPFDKGTHEQPLAELFDLAANLAANRLYLTMGARIWSLDDPIMPAINGADLRQRVVMVHRAEAPPHGAPFRLAEAWPFDLNGSDVAWHERFAPSELPVGWVTDAVLQTVGRGAARFDEPYTIGLIYQAEQMDLMGHVLWFGPQTAILLAAAAQQAAMLRA